MGHRAIILVQGLFLLSNQFDHLTGIVQLVYQIESQWGYFNSKIRVAF